MHILNTKRLIPSFNHHPSPPSIIQYFTSLFTITALQLPSKYVTPNLTQPNSTPSTLNHINDTNYLTNSFSLTSSQHETNFTGFFFISHCHYEKE
ncbi:hypothetical protein ACTXT7_014665 [Hymenolepis weldensis]